MWKPRWLKMPCLCNSLSFYLQWAARIAKTRIHANKRISQENRKHFAVFHAKLTNWHINRSENVFINYFFLAWLLKPCWHFSSLNRRNIYIRDEDPEFFSTDPDPAELKKNAGSGSGSDSGSVLKSKSRKKYIYILGK